MKHLLAILLIFSRFYLIAQPINNSTFIADIYSEKNPWSNLDFFNDESTFQFAVISDLTGGYRHGMFPVAVEKINMLMPEFVMSVGDLIEGYTQDSVQIDGWWEEFNGWVNDLKMPFFYVPGNHDVTNKLLVRKWKERFGRTYYHFKYKNVLFLALDTQDGGIDEMGDEQVAYVEKTLKENQDVMWTLVFFHSPNIWREGNENFKKVEALLTDRKYTVIAGHSHVYQKSVRQDRNYYVLSVTGGGSELMGPEYGQFDEIAWITMTKEGPILANLRMDGIVPEDIVTDESAPVAVSFLRSTRMTNSPIKYNGGNLKEANTTLYFQNRGKLPLHIKSNFIYHPSITPSFAKLDTTLAPETKLELPLQLTFSQVNDFAALEPLSMQWDMQYDLERRPDLKLNGTYDIAVVPVYDCPKVNKKVKLDGNWTEWNNPIVVKTPGELGYYAHTWQGADDCSMEFVTTHDDKNLYIAVNVKDDDYVKNLFRSYWEQDGIELNITLPNAEKNKNTIKLGFSPGESEVLTIIEDPKQLPEGWRISSLTTPTGHVSEVAIPLEDLKKMSKGELKEFQLQVIVYDHDGKEDQYKGTQFIWRKDHPGGGTFRLTQK